MTYALTDLSQPDSPLLHTRDVRGVHTLTLNAPASFNVLGEAMLAALQHALDAVRDDPGARMAVLAASGKAFCAGHNLKEMKASPELGYYQKLFAQCTRVMLSIQNLPVPVIARVQGLATAAGCQLVAQADLAVAVETARFGVNGIDAGLFCATPSVPLVNRVVPADALDAEVARLVEAVLSKPREALALGKQLFYKQREMGIEAAYQLAGQTMACNMVHPVAQEGVQAFIEKRKPQWPV